MAIFGCDPCETGQLCPAKIFLDIEALSRESDRQSSNLGHQSSNFQTPKIRFLFQNEKVLIAKEMALRRTSVAGELRAYAPWGCLPCAENDRTGRHEFGRRERRSCFSCWRSERHGGQVPDPRNMHNVHPEDCPREESEN